MGLAAIATMTALVTETTTARVTGTEIAMAIVEAAGSIAPTLHDIRRLMAARTAGSSGRRERGWGEVGSRRGG